MNEHKTAISRKGPSAPMKALDSLGLLEGRVLNYGSGKGRDSSHYGLESYDPHYSPTMPGGKFNTIVCVFVLNVIESVEIRRSVVLDIQDRLENDGNAYIAVRSDKKNLNGTTKIGTYQTLIVLDAPIVAKGSGFVVYKIDKDYS